MVFVPSNLTYEALVVFIHGIICANSNSFVYDLRSLLNTHRKIARFMIQNDRDLQYVLRVRHGDSEIYVTIERHPNSM